VCAPKISPANRTSRDLDLLATYESADAQLLAAPAPTRYAVRQVLDQELHKTLTARENTARLARFRVGRAAGLAADDDLALDDKENKTRPPAAGHPHKKAGPGACVKRDFFGRIVETPSALRDVDGNARRGGGGGRKLAVQDEVWVTYHEGLNNAVRKPISLEEFLQGL